MRCGLKLASYFFAFFFAAASAPEQTRLSRVLHQPAPTHSRQFWRTIAQNKYAIPDDEPVFPLVRELNGYLGNADPELRDDLAYTILDVWIVHQKQLSSAELISLLDEWQANLRAGIGETDTDTVLRRSFSALCLAVLAERDLETPFLGEHRYRELLDSSINYLKDERDLRGFDSVKGWIHATAHAGDLLAFLAANPFFKVEDQSRVLGAISNRLSSARQIFSYGEQDRLAFAVAAIVTRKDFDASAFHQWLSALEETDRKLWRNSPPNDELLKTFQNNNYMLHALVARLYPQSRTSGITKSLDEVTQVLRKR